MGDMGGGGVKNLKKEVTYFVNGPKFQKISDVIYEWPLILLYFSTFQCQWRMFGSNCPIFGEITMFEKIKVLA